MAKVGCKSLSIILTGAVPNPSLWPSVHRYWHTRRKPGSQSHGSSPPPRRRS